MIYFRRVRRVKSVGVSRIMPLGDGMCVWVRRPKNEIQIFPFENAPVPLVVKVKSESFNVWIQKGQFV